MSAKVYTTIVGTGSFIPKKIISNNYFLDAEFYDPSTGRKFDTPNPEIIRKFYEITNIEERRYAEQDQVTSDLATFAAREAIESSGIDPESLEFLIVAHNFGDISDENPHTDILPALASRVKANLRIQNPVYIMSRCHGRLSGMDNCYDNCGCIH